MKHLTNIIGAVAFAGIFTGCACFPFIVHYSFPLYCILIGGGLFVVGSFIEIARLADEQAKRQEKEEQRIRKMYGL